MDVNLLPVPQSRSELFLDYIARNSNDLSKLPVPMSRIELFLDYIARNMNAGGNGGNITIDSILGLRDELNKKAETLAISAGGDLLQLLGANDELLSSVPIMTQQQVQDIKDLFI